MLCRGSTAGAEPPHEPHAFPSTSYQSHLTQCQRRPAWTATSDLTHHVLGEVVVSLRSFEHAPDRVLLHRLEQRPLLLRRHAVTGSSTWSSSSFSPQMIASMTSWAYPFSIASGSQ
jgi:hypothetical protein